MSNVKVLWILLLSNDVLCSSLQVMWNIIVTTGTMPLARTDAEVHLNITDSSDLTQYVSLGNMHPRDSVQILSTPLTIAFPVSLFLYLDNKNGWNLEFINLTNTETNVTYPFYCGCWINGFGNTTVTASTTPTTALSSTSSTESTLINATTTYSTTNQSQKNTYTTQVSHCHCACSLPQNPSTFDGTYFETVKAVESLKNELKVDKAKLSSTTRKLTSTKDNRTSSKAVGYVGCAILVSLGLMLVMFSIMKCLREILKGDKADLNFCVCI